MSTLDHYQVIIMSLFWTLALMVPIMAYQSHTYSWSTNSDGNMAATNSFSSSHQSSFSSNSMSSGSTISNWPSSSMSESVSDEALDDQNSWRKMTLTIHLPGARPEDIQVQVYPADADHPQASISVHARHGQHEFRQDFKFDGITNDGEMPEVQQTFEGDGRLSLKAKFKVARDDGVNFDNSAFQQSAFSSSPFGDAFAPMQTPQRPDTSFFNTPFFKNTGFPFQGFGNF